MRASATAVDFRTARDLRVFADSLGARRGTLSGDESYFLAKALEECQFTTTVNEDVAAYGAKQRRQFLAGLTPGDPNNPRRITAFDAVDSTQRCARFQGTKISQKDIEDLYLASAQQGDARAPGAHAGGGAERQVACGAAGNRGQRAHRRPNVAAHLRCSSRAIRKR
jgi:hypothetical protein